MKQACARRCGHLYCWACLYQWTTRQPSCPVCKDHVDEMRVVPIYTRQSPASASERGGAAGVGGMRIPPRPAGFRLLMPADAAQHDACASGARRRGSAAGGASPRAWGVIPWNRGPGRPAVMPPLSPQTQSLLTQLLLCVGSLFMLAMLLW